ncbi:MAG: DMT family transporter [Treponema sp.]|nr:DMT family transporter [Treponema sp.]
MTVKPQNDSKLLGQGAVLLCAILWSTSGLFIRLVDWHPVIIAGIRSLIAAVFMFAVRSFFVSKQRPKNRAFPLWGGAICYALTMLLFVIANKLTTSANAILLQYSAPIWAAIFGWLLIKEKPHWEHWAAIICIFGGFFLFLRDGLATGDLLGDSIALLSGVFFGVNSVFLRMQKDGNPADSMLLSHVICFCISIPFIIIYPPSLKTNTVLPILFMGVIQIGCASLLFSYGVRRISAVQSMLTASIEPLLNPVWVLVFTGEMPSVLAIAGGGIILAAVLASTLIGNARNTGSGKMVV